LTVIAMLEPYKTDLHKLDLHTESLSALADHFAQFPQTHRELEVISKPLNP
jgi:hypothetical protein